MNKSIVIPTLYATAVSMAVITGWSYAISMITNEYQSPLSFSLLLFIMMIVLLLEITGMVTLAIVAHILRSIAIRPFLGRFSLMVLGAILGFFLLTTGGIHSQWTLLIPGTGSALIWLTLNRDFFG